MTQKRNRNFIESQKIYALMLVGAFILLGSFSLLAQNSSGTASVSDIAAETENKRQEIDKEVEQIEQNIQYFVAAAKFQDAEREYDQISKLYNSLSDDRLKQIKRSLLQSKKNLFYKKWADYLEDQAANAFLNKEYDKSIKLSEESIGIIKKINLKQASENGKVPFEMFQPIPNSKDTKAETDTQLFLWTPPIVTAYDTVSSYNNNLSANQEKLIQNSTYAKDNKQFTQEISLDGALPEYKYRVMDMDTYITDAQVYMKNKEYDKAKDCLEKALVLDPYNYKAMTMLQTLYTQILDTGKARAQAKQYEAIAQAQWMNNEAVPPNITSDEVLKVIEAQSENMNNMKEKLNSMVIPKVDFEDASVSSVITYLSRESKIADEKEGKGINIILRLSNTQVQPKSVSIQLDDVPIGEVIRYVCLYSGLKYRIEEDAVIIGDDSIDKMETKFFQIKSGLINSIISNLTVDEINLDAKKSFDATSMLATSKIEGKKVLSTDLQVYFLQRGLPFPPGSNIAWDSKTSMLVITNTPENIRIAESLIKEIDVNIPLVLIETKFVEITQYELEELAFKWRLNYQGAKTGINPYDQGGGVQGNDAIINHYTNPNTDNQYALVNDFAVNSDNKQLNLNFWMYAIDQSKTVEVLSSPKVITKSGSAAFIEMVKKVYYPTDWTQPTVPTGDVNSTITFSGPEFGEPTDLGIMMWATPTVSPNNHTILLDLKPQVVDFVGWDNYSYQITQTTQGVDTPRTIDSPVKMAQISHRDVVTKVKIYDGETIVLGGTIREDAIYVDDSMPFLSDVPLFGRLFRSKYQDVERKNLIIFVSARLINPDGTPFREQSNSFFDFGR